MAELEPAPPRSWLPWLIGGLSITGVILVVAGRLLDAEHFQGWQDPFYSVLLAFSVDGTFLNPQNPLTPLGALLIAVSLYLAVGGGVALALATHIAAFRARILSGHIVVIGAGERSLKVAHSIALHARCVLLDKAHRGERNLLRLAQPQDTSALVAAGNLLKARAVVFDLPADEDNAALALALGRVRKEETPAIWAHVRDQTIAERVAGQLGGAQRIEIFSEADLVARALFAKHPAHQVAEAAGAQRVHTLIVGFTALGQAVAEEAVYSGIADGLGSPMVTIIDKDAGQLEQLFRAGRPALDLAADFAFIATDPQLLFSVPRYDPQALEQLRQRDEVAPVTGISLCLEEGTQNARLALALGPFRRSEGRFFAPVNMRVASETAAQLGEAPDGKSVCDWAQGATPMDGAAELIAADVLDRAGRDRLARALHETYRNGPAASSVAGWNDIPETLRRANRKGADHFAAKLFSLGLVANRRRSEAAPKQEARSVLHMVADGKAVDTLATLERRRWVAERVFDGWVPGEPRDDDRRVHPLLTGGVGAVLTESDRDKDRAQVQIALSALSTSANHVMRDVRIGLAGHRRLSPEIEKSITDQVVPLFEVLGHDDAVTLVTPLAPGADIALAEGAIQALAGKVGALRLIVLEAVPYEIVLEVAARDEGLDAASIERLIADVRARRAALVASVEHVDVVRVGIAGRSDHSYRRDRPVFESALRRANAYLARRADRLIVAWDGAPARGPGGTGELVAWRRDPALIPAELDFPQRTKVNSKAPELTVIPVHH
jgi:hypothetical protein